jgi:hypothetical protein
VGEGVGWTVDLAEELPQDLSLRMGNPRGRALSCCMRCYSVGLQMRLMVARRCKFPKSRWPSRQGLFENMTSIGRAAQRSCLQSTSVPAASGVGPGTSVLFQMQKVPSFIPISYSSYHHRPLQFYIDPELEKSHNGRNAFHGLGCRE